MSNARDLFKFMSADEEDCLKVFARIDEREMCWHCLARFINFDVRYTSSSLNSLLIFTKSFSCSFSYKKFCFSSSSVGDVGDWLRDGAGDGPLIESVGSAASSILGVFLVLPGTLYDDVDGSLWHSTSSTFSRCGELRASSLSQILFDGFSEKRRCWEIRNANGFRAMKSEARLTFWLPDGMFSALFAFRHRTLCDP